MELRLPSLHSSTSFGELCPLLSWGFSIKLPLMACGGRKMYREGAQGIGSAECLLIHPVAFCVNALETPSANAAPKVVIKHSQV